MKFEIKHKFSGNVLFSVEAETFRAALEIAVGSKANLWEANLREADLRGADLRGADLRGADLRGANLWGANLWGANLWEANLRGANLRGADLREAKNINPYRCTPLLMLLDQPGLIRAYKLVTDKCVGPYNGGIEYEIGNGYFVEDANTDTNEQCGAGISVATLDWCMNEWREGYRVFIAEFEAKDIAAIPTATDGKFRLHRCKIVGEVDLKKIGLVGEGEAT